MNQVQNLITERGYRLPRDEPQAVPQVVQDAAPVPRNRECVVCQERERTIVFQGCRHLVVCEICKNNLVHNARFMGVMLRCPVCRRLHAERELLQIYVV